MKINEMVSAHSALQKNEPVLLILRHAEKYVVDDFRLDSQQKITPAGALDAKAIGKSLGSCFSKVNNIKSSPIDRCGQTADAIKDGLEFSGEIQVMDVLNADGVYVQDVNLAKANFINNNNPIGVFRKMLDGDVVGGMNNVEHATAVLLQALLNDLNEIKSPALYITHDSILALFVGTLLRCNFTQENWFGYLEGIAIKKISETYYLYWNDNQYDITIRCRELLTLLDCNALQSEELQEVKPILSM